MHLQLRLREVQTGYGEALAPLGNFAHFVLLDCQILHKARHLTAVSHTKLVYVHLFGCFCRTARQAIRLVYCQQDAIRYVALAATKSGRGQILQRASPSWRPRWAMACSSHSV